MYLSGKKAGEKVYDSLLYHFKVDENTFCRLTKKKASFYLKRIKILRKRLQNRRLNASRPGIVYSDNAPVVGECHLQIQSEAQHLKALRG